MPPNPTLHGRTRTDLLRSSRDAVRRAAAVSGGATTVPALVEHLGLLSEMLTGCRAALDATCEELWRRSRAGSMQSVDGLFAGEPDAAVTTMILWSTRAAETADEARDALDSAHVAVAGLAERG